MSIVIPYYKGEKFIFRNVNALFSAYKALKNEFVFEIIIIDSMEDKNVIEQKLLTEYNRYNNIRIIINDENSG